MLPRHLTKIYTKKFNFEVAERRCARKCEDRKNSLRIKMRCSFINSSSTIVMDVSGTTMPSFSWMLSCHSQKKTHKQLKAFAM